VALFQPALRCARLRAALQVGPVHSGCVASTIRINLRFAEGASQILAALDP
jgi:hypothetical protein